MRVVEDDERLHLASNCPSFPGRPRLRTACARRAHRRDRIPPAGAQVEFEHVALGDGQTVELGNTAVTAIATPGHAPAHHAYTVADRRRGDEKPWLAFSGDSLLIGDVGRPDLHVAGDARGQARLLHVSLRRLLELPDYVVLYPSHYGGSVCGRGLSGNPFSSIGFERSHNPLLAIEDPEGFADPRSRTSRRGPSSMSGSSLPIGPARWAFRRDAGSARSARERAPVRTPGRPERARRRDGRARTKRAAARRHARLPTAFDRCDPCFRRRVRRRQGRQQPRLRRTRRADRPQAAARLGLGSRASGRTADRAGPSWWFVVAVNLLLGITRASPGQ